MIQTAAASKLFASYRAESVPPAQVEKTLSPPPVSPPVSPKGFLHQINIFCFIIAAAAPLGSERRFY